MKKFLIAAMVGFVLLGAASQPAEAFFFKKHFFFKKWHFKKPPKVTESEPSGRPGGSKHSWVPKYIFASTACSALVLWIQALHTSQTEHRELTQKEAWTTIGNCYLPFIGGHIMGSLAQQP